MKPSNFKTPRTRAECRWPTDYASVRPMGDRSSIRERIADWLLAIAIGVGLAALLVAWWSS